MDRTNAPRPYANNNMSTGNFRPAPQQTFDSEEMRGSMQNILSINIGEYVVIEFLIGTERMMRKQGILYEVGTSFVTLFDDEAHDYIVCDIFSIKFVYFYYPGERPNNTPSYNTLPPYNANGTSTGGNMGGNGRNGR